MRKSFVFALVVAFAVTGCKKKDKKETKPTDAPAPMASVMKAGPGTTPAPGMTAPTKPAIVKVAVPKGASIAVYCKAQGTPQVVSKKGTLKKHNKMAALITAAGKKCKELSESKCPEYKALKSFVNDVWMGKQKLDKKARLRAYATAINLLLHKNKKVAAAAIQGTINGYLYRHEWVVKNPELLPQKYIKKMLKAVANMDESINMGFLIQDVAELAPAYGLMDEVFKVAQENLAKNKSLVEYALTNMVKHGNVCLFKHIQAHSKDPMNLKSLQAAAQATNGLLKKKMTAKHRHEICAYSDNFVTGKFSPATVKSWDFSGYAYRYLDVVTSCKRFQAIPKVKLFRATASKDLKKRVNKVIQELKAVKKALAKAPK